MKSLLTLSILILSMPMALAAPTEPAFPLDPSALRRMARPAPYGAEFTGRIKFRLPEGLHFVTKDKINDFADVMKIALIDDEAGAVLPGDVSWYTMIYLLKDDPLEGQKDLANLNKDQLLEWQEKFTANHTPRKAGTAKTWNLGNWTHPVAYDADKKQLVLGMRMTSEAGETTQELLNYKIIFYGPDKQIVCLQMIAPLKSDWAKAVARQHKLVEEFKFPEVIHESSQTEELIYYAKLIGGGLAGMVVVMLLARQFMGNKRRGAAVSPLRRQGLPR